MKEKKMETLKFLSVMLIVIFFVATSIADETGLDQRLPVIDCTVDYAHGGFDAYGAPQKGDRLKIDLNDYTKIEVMLEFEPIGHAGPSYISLAAPFKAEDIKFSSSGSFDHMRLVSESKDREDLNWKVTFDIQSGVDAQSIVIITGEQQLINSVAVLLCQEQ